MRGFGRYARRNIRRRDRSGLASFLGPQIRRGAPGIKKRPVLRSLNAEIGGKRGGLSSSQARRYKRTLGFRTKKFF